MSQVAEKIITGDVAHMDQVAAPLPSAVTNTGVDQSKDEIASTVGQEAIASAAAPTNEAAAALLKVSVWLDDEDKNPKEIVNRSQDLLDSYEKIKGRLSVTIDTAGSSKMPDPSGVKAAQEQWSSFYLDLKKNADELDKLAKERIQKLSSAYDEASRAHKVGKTAEKAQGISEERLVNQAEEDSGFEALQRDRSQEIALLKSTWDRIMKRDTEAVEQLKWLSVISDNGGKVPSTVYTVGYSVYNALFGSSTLSKAAEKPASTEKEEQEPKAVEAAAPSADASETEAKEEAAAVSEENTSEVAVADAAPQQKLEDGALINV